MPLVYFVAAGIGVLAATFVAGMIRTKETRKQMRDQLLLSMDSKQDNEAHSHEPAAMVSAR